ncbi:MAG: zinc-ribbon domain-containing protein [Lachnospiraceae bacterium]|nr:zinc-ribbon domain-containing protein [Lachnospiraceae bacterium]
MYCRKCGNEIGEDERFCAYCGTAVGMEDSGEAVKRKKKKILPWLIAVASVFLLAVILIAVFVFGSTERRYEKQLRLAERYLDEMDYDKAIAAYEAAIAIDSMREDAYLGLADVYLAMEDSEAAVDILEEGYEVSGIRRLRSKKEKIQEKLVKADDKEKAATEGEEDAIPEEEEELPPVPGFLDLQIIDYAKEPISGVKAVLKDVQGNILAETVSIDNGRVGMEYPEAGSYTLILEEASHMGREIEMELASEYVERKIVMLPQINDDKVYMLLEWQGSRDLDLCGYDTATSACVNATGLWGEGMYLTGDNGPADCFEVMEFSYYGDSDPLKLVYVLDTSAYQNGIPSAMEKEGADLSVFSSQGRIFHIRANPEENAALWNPCDCSGGKVIKEDRYIYDSGEYARIYPGIENDSGIELGKRDRRMLTAMAEVLFECSAAEVGKVSIYDNRMLKTLVKKQTGVISAFYCESDMEALSVEEVFDDNSMGKKISEYEIDEAEKRLEELFAVELDLRTDLPSPDAFEKNFSGWDDQKDPYGNTGTTNKSCVYDDGKLFSLEIYGEYVVTVDYVQCKNLNGKQELLFNCQDCYGGDTHTNGYLNLYLVPAVNDFGYEIESFTYEPVMSW